MRILVCNDDGIDSFGLKILTDIAKEISSDFWVAAPSAEQSGKSHAISIANPVKFFQVDTNRISVGGTPADCVIVAMSEFFKNKKPDLILSGINIGSNLAEDIRYSGTIGAAMEGAFHGIKSVAFSQEIIDYSATASMNWATARNQGSKILNKILSLYNDLDDEQTIFSVNFPEMEPGKEARGIRVVPHGVSSSRNRITKENNEDNGSRCWVTADLKKKNISKQIEYSDIDAINDGFISITPIMLQSTSFKTLNKIKDKMEND